VVADPPGTWHYDSQNQMDVRAEKQLPLRHVLGGSGRVGLQLECYNIFNVAPVTILGGAGINNITGPAFGQIIHTTPPRTFRIGARVTF